LLLLHIVSIVARPYDEDDFEDNGNFDNDYLGLEAGDCQGVNCATPCSKKRAAGKMCYAYCDGRKK
ncbi:hypothetical protein PENTCL1PPCAC_11012, partial [Pristionchus entomophagus]